MIRAFIAIEVEDRSVLSRIIEVRDRIMGLGIDAKPVEDENIHLTLRFLGEIDEGLIPGIERAMARLSIYRPFRIRVSGIGVFPDMRMPRVVWVGVDEGSEILRSMRSMLDESLRGLRIHEDQHGFSPHITIARVRGRVNLDKLSRYVEENRDYVLGYSPVTRVVLKRSVLTPRGPIYSDLRRVFLGQEGEGLEGSGGGSWKDKAKR